MSSRIKKSIVQPNQTCTIPLAFWIVSALAIAIVFFMHIYGDVLITAKQGKVFWDCLFSGRPMSFYKEAVFELDYPYDGYVYHAAYPFIIYFFFAVWEFPVWILEKITNENLYDTTCNHLWIKVFLVVFLILCMQQLYKVVIHIDEIKDKAHLAVFLFLTSSLMLTATGIASQYDIVTLFFILLGLDAWICGRQQRFFLMFMIAISFKYFALLFFIPLLLIREKRILRIICLTICSVLPTLFLWYVFPKPDDQISNVKNLLGMFTTGTINLGKASIIPFFVVMVFVCLYAYFFSSNTIKDAVFLLLIVAGAFCFIANTYPYWVVLGSPIFILAVLLSNGNTNKAIWCETIMCAGLVAINYLRYDWVFSSKTLAAMNVFPALFGVPRESMVDNSIGAHSLLLHLPINESFYYSIIICAFVFLIILVKPKQKKIELLEPLSYGTIAVRSVLNISIAMLPLLINIAYFVLGLRR